MQVACQGRAGLSANAPTLPTTTGQQQANFLSLLINTRDRVSDRKVLVILQKPATLTCTCNFVRQECLYVLPDGELKCDMSVEDKLLTLQTEVCGGQTGCRFSF